MLGGKPHSRNVAFRILHSPGPMALVPPLPHSCYLPHNTPRSAPILPALLARSDRGEYAIWLIWARERYAIWRMYYAPCLRYTWSAIAGRGGGKVRTPALLDPMREEKIGHVGDCAMPSACLILEALWQSGVGGLSPVFTSAPNKERDMAMRRTVLLLAVMASALVVASGVAWAATIECPNRSGNLCVGTKKSDTMTGASSADEMRGRAGMDRMRAAGGNDTISGGLGDDVVRGGTGADTISGDEGLDRLYGDAGSDTIYTAGAYGDQVDCGNGTDKAYVDRADRVVNCEEVIKVRM